MQRQRFLWWRVTALAVALSRPEIDAHRSAKQRSAKQARGRNRSALAQHAACKRVCALTQECMRVVQSRLTSYYLRAVQSKLVHSGSLALHNNWQQCRFL
eukprot:4121-Pelagomonas_calceolata.AAC.1